MDNNQQVQVDVKEVEEMNVAYVRHIGAYQGKQEVFSELFAKLVGWAGPRGLLGVPGMQVLCVYHDDPNITQEDKLRVDACITVPTDTKVEGEVGTYTVAGGKYAFARFEVFPDEFSKAWDAVMGGWLPDSGYQPDDRPCLTHIPCLSHR